MKGISGSLFQCHLSKFTAHSVALNPESIIIIVTVVTVVTVTASVRFQSGLATRRRRRLDGLDGFG